MNESGYSPHVTLVKHGIVPEDLSFRPHPPPPKVRVHKHCKTYICTAQEDKQSIATRREKIEQAIQLMDALLSFQLHDIREPTPVENLKC